MRYAIFSSLLILSAISHAGEEFYPEWSQHLRIDKMIDSDLDEYIYHEILIHASIIAHGRVKKVLIIGGRGGGTLREVVRHKPIEKIVMVEIDKSVIGMAKEYLSAHFNRAFEDPRLELVIADGAEYVKKTPERFDVIICNPSDPTGPAEVLFTEEFYGHCKKILNPRGIFVNRNGVLFRQVYELRDCL